MQTLNKRYCKIILSQYDKNGNIEDKKEFENSLDVRFAYQRYFGNGMHSKGNISICGLSKKTLDRYISFFSEDVEVEKRKTIKIIAGYEDNDKSGCSCIGEILNGTIVNALPTLPPDIWLNCEVINQYEEKLKAKAYNFVGIKTLEEVIKWAVQEIGLTEDKIINRITDREYLNTKYVDFTFEGNKFDFINKISADFNNINSSDKYGGINTYIEDNNVIVDYRNLTLKDRNRLGTPRLVSKDSTELTLIGIPEPMWAGQAVNITTLLNSSVRTGDVLELKSNMIESLNGYYYVFSILYIGEYRGQQWYSQFLCRRLI